MPAYGTSTLLHVAVGMAAWFLSMQVASAPADVRFNYNSDVVTEHKIKIEPRKDRPKATMPQPTKLSPASQNPDGKLGDNGHGAYKPGGRSFLKDIFENPKFGLVDGPLPPPGVFGTGGGGGVRGGTPGFGRGGPGGGGIFPVPWEEEVPGKIVYVVDRSGSMTDTLDIVKVELKRSLSELVDASEFHVIFYSSGPPVEMPARRLVNATERNKQLAYEFIDTVVAQGETDPSQALQRAFGCKPDFIYLLTDGEFDRQIVDLVGRLSAGSNTKVNTIGFLSQSGDEVLRQIADKTGGSHKVITEKDLQGIAQGR
jgi:hypothetical protein